LISLVERHEQAFYSFVHKVQSKGEGLFDSLMHWIELFLSLTREGFGQQVSLEFILPHTGEEREQIMKEIDDVALYYYKMKLFYEEKLRRRFGRAQAGGGDADADDAAAQELVEGVVKELSFGELVKSDANDIAAGESETESGSGASSSEEEDDTSSSEDGEDVDTSVGEPTPKPSRPVSKVPGEVRRARSPVKPPAPNINPRSRSRPDYHLNRPMYQPPPPPLPNAGTTSRPRLRHSKSFSGSSFSTPPGSISDTPPVPSLSEKGPPAAPGAGPSYGRERYSADEPRTQQQQQQRPVTAARGRFSPTHKKKKKKGGAASLKPPELVFIPKLLPLFLEMVSVLLLRKAPLGADCLKDYSSPSATTGRMNPASIFLLHILLPSLVLFALHKPRIICVNFGSPSLASHRQPWQLTTPKINQQRFWSDPTSPPPPNKGGPQCQ
jgi:hypothetical protein